MKKITKYSPPRQPLEIGTLRFVSVKAAAGLLGAAAAKLAEIGPPEGGKNQSVFVRDGRYFIRECA